MPDTKPPQGESTPGQVLKVTQVIKVDFKVADIQSVRMVGVDIIIELKSGERLVIPEGGVRAMMDPEFKIRFADSDVLVAALINDVGGVNVPDLALIAPADTVLGHGMLSSETAGDGFADNESANRPLSQRDGSARTGLLWGSNRVDPSAPPTS